MSLTPLVQEITDLPAYNALLAGLPTGGTPLDLGLARAARLPLLAALRKGTPQPILLITDRADRAFTLADELALWAPEAPRLIFPEPNPLFYEEASWGRTVRRERLVALNALAAYHLPGHARKGNSDRPNPPIIIASARAVMTRTFPRRDYIKATQTLKIGSEISPEDLLRAWVAMGYEPVTTVVAPGQFARRGGILDIWPQPDEFPLRLDFFGDEIDTLRRFDPTTQRTIKNGGIPEQGVRITPAREFIVEDYRQKANLELLLPTDGDLEEAVPRSNEIPEVTEFHIPSLHPTPAGVLDYLPKGAMVLIDNYEALQETVHELEEQAIALREDALAEARIPKHFPLPYLTWDQILDSIEGNPVLRLGPKKEGQAGSVANAFSANPRFGGQLKPLMDYLTDLHGEGGRMVIVSRQADRLSHLWKEQVGTRAAQPGPAFIQGSLGEGWTLTPALGLPIHLLSDGEIFGWRRPQPRQRQRPIREAPEASYADLQINDWVVHVDHGIGRFKGLVSRLIDDAEREFLCVEYARGDQLYVPVHQADRLTQYLGPEGQSPSPTRLGGTEWRNVKKRVAKAVEEVAEDLLDLYAKRQTVVGYAYSPDTGWQRELEASFPYIETEDQLRVIKEVKHDLEAPRPMDRLICGDVGYGKTEVALRAAFKAVMDGKQVAILVPTTVLAQQHYHTFKQRLAAFPVEVEMLSRFRTQREQRTILHGMAEGTVDIIIGTHRLLQPDITFDDLGLLIIDEEQRFGVTHKEFLKQKRTEVDVLTMTATPIPRTLYMAMTGVRDISMINTPPEERLPIITHVGPFSKRLVRQAVLRELDRGGQVFFVHNRVQTIQAIRNQLTRIVPEARITIAHGQMPERQLATRMREFTSGDIDVLLTTTIIESGLDIPNANTLIVDRADTFGLAQLYQLRGRVGRGAQRAYAYFLRHKRRKPTHEGRQRLETIAENTQLGAGFSIAMRDMEIRGAGDILGTRQHGHIAAVGFHLYTRLLADAVKRQRGDREAPAPIAVLEGPRPIVSVDLPLAINIPSGYIPDKSMRLKLYRRLANLRSLSEVNDLEEEFTDRFGPPPNPVRNLFYQLKVKILAENIGLVSVAGTNGQLVLRFPATPQGGPRRSYPPLDPQVRTSKDALWLPRKSHPNWTGFLIDVLQDLQDN